MGSGSVEHDTVLHEKLIQSPTNGLLEANARQTKAKCEKRKDTNCLSIIIINRNRSCLLESAQANQDIANKPCKCHMHIGQRSDGKEWGGIV